ncbi:related to DNA-directed RNA polymerase III subunit RPC7 [Saccharomycodes ludwigii]|uniref:DNA-directed RNA polymerase III subunit n=1 Tax=Saccharomycodes ludwigii TaxID=36035 RepID=A0A376B4J7_9ASCO|nr:hypothetical protein SCDLUD_002854 [Saccharomycodes ludwigii]KAH3901362.1 hypothetical protein SCDLUD_002854 [Saccharomycodes ludwigii]SSD59384.1 related to DNA-directed RNA polymerase III subunit RPC7 [Saccharomycodes ludwigii]
MSFRRGGGGGSRGFQSNLPFGLSYSDVGSYKNQEIPTIPLPVNNPITNYEKDISLSYINFQETMKNGPFHTGDVQPESELERLQHDDGIERYSDRYLNKNKNINKSCASINEHPFQLELFPQELYPVMGIKNKNKILALSKLKSKDDIFFNNEEAANIAGLTMLEKLKELAEDEDELNNNNNNNGNGNNPKINGQDDIEEDDEDDDFDEDDDENDDYNGEKYFDNGEDDDYGDEDDGDEPAF